MPYLTLRNNLLTPRHLKVVGDNYSVNFTGTNSYIDLGGDSNETYASTLSPSSDWGMAAWIKLPEGRSGNDMIFSSGSVTGSGSYIRLEWRISNTTDLLELRHLAAGGTTTITADDAISDDTWTLFTVSYNSSTGTVTQTVGSNTHSGSWAPSGNINGSRAVLGTLSQTISSYELTGNIASFAMFNDEITAGNRSSMLTKSDFRMSTLSHCTHWWRMGDGVGDANPSSGDAIIDQIGDIDGELENSTVVAGQIV